MKESQLYFIDIGSICWLFVNYIYDLSNTGCMLSLQRTFPGQRTKVFNAKLAQFPSNQLKPVVLDEYVHFCKPPVSQQHTKCVMQLCSDTPRYITFTPTQRDKYFPTEVISCQAFGNPPVVIQWKDVSDNKLYNSTELLTTEDMLTMPQRWQCVASNVIRGKSISVTRDLNFSVISKYFYLSTSQ